MSSARNVVITGASSGIGRATAREFAARGYNVGIVARRAELLDSLVAELKTAFPDRKVVAVPGDICSWDDVERAAKTFRAELGKVHVLVNNAGAFDYRALNESSHDKLDQMIDVNVRGLVYVTKVMLPLMKDAAGEWAKIVNVSSLSGLWGFPNLSTYSATKFAVAGFSSGLRRELSKEKIHVSTIFPGPVNNKVQTRADLKDQRARRLTMFPDQIARQIFELATSRRKNRISHPAFSFLNMLERVSPRMVDKLFKILT